MVFDTAGGKNLENSFQAVKYEGTIVTTNIRVTLDLSIMQQKAIRLQGVLMLLPLLLNKNRERYAQILQEIAKIVEAGKLRPMIDPHPFSFNDVAAAHALLESGEATGKIVLKGF